MSEDSHYRFKATCDRIDKAEATGIALHKAIKETLNQTARKAYPVFESHQSVCSEHLEPLLEKHTHKAFDCFDYAHWSNARADKVGNYDTSSKKDHPRYKKEVALHQELKAVFVNHYEAEILDLDSPYLKSLDSSLFSFTIWYFDALAQLFSRRSGVLYHLREANQILKEQAHSSTDDTD